MIRTSSIAVCAFANSAAAIALPDCTRTTHISHGGEAFHRDMGEGRVMWLDWWSQEGSAHDIKIMECGSGEVLSFRTHEDNMNARPPFHKTEQLVKVVEDQHQGARVFATLERIAGAVSKSARDVVIKLDTRESCACAALYPELRGDKAEFRIQ